MTISLAEIEMYGNLSGAWTDQSVSPSVCTILNGQLWLDSDGTGAAIAEQAVTINENVLHVLKLTVQNGPVNVRIGPTSGSYSLLDLTAIGTGIHYLEFTPAIGTVYVQIWHKANAGRVIDDVSILPGTELRITTPYAEADIPYIHYQQLSDVQYLTCDGYEPRRIERRGHRSWSVTKFRPDDGPFQSTNITETTMKASATSGEITLTASASKFTSDHVGTLIQLSGAGQYVTKTATGGDTYSAGIKVTGIGSGQRTFGFLITGTFVASVRVQRSSGNENNYQDYLGPYTSPTQGTHYDAQDNQTWYFRLAVKSGEFTSGAVVMSLTFAGGSTTGVGRIVSVISGTEARAECLSNMPGVSSVKTWKLGSWNATDGWPVGVTHGFGRLWLGRGTRVWASKADDFTSFLEGTESDQAISARLGTGSPEAVSWLGFTGHLVIGTKTQEFLGLANSQQEVVSPTNFQILPRTHDGSSNLMPVTAPGTLIYVHRTLKKIIQFVQDPKAISDTSYTAVDLNRLSPDLLWDGVVKLAIQDEPERRIYVVLKNGLCQVLLFRREEEVVAWGTIKTDGFIEDVSVVPQSGSDSVTFIVRRTIGGAQKRYIEKLGDELVLNDEDYYHLDSSVEYALTRPETKLQLIEAAIPTSPRSFTLSTEASAFVVGDVGKKVWAHIDDATLKLTISAYTSATAVTATLDWGMEPGEQGMPEFDAADDEDRVAPAGRWGMNTAVTAFAGLSHLDGRDVRLFGDMVDYGTATVSAGAVTFPSAVSVAYVGLPFKSRWKSLKLSYGAQKGTALTMSKAVKSVAFILHRCGATLTYGFSFGKLRPLKRNTSLIPMGAPVPLYSGEQFEAFDAQYRKDARVCLEVDGPHPATVSAYVPTISEHDR